MRRDEFRSVNDVNGTAAPHSDAGPDELAGSDEPMNHGWFRRSDTGEESLLTSGTSNPNATTLADITYVTPISFIMKALHETKRFTHAHLNPNLT